MPDVQPAGFADPPAGIGPERYRSQAVRWRRCGDFECAQVLVPLDYADPDRQAITLAMRRRAASEARQGTIFVNPGGPGYGGQDLVASFRTEGLEQYDIVGWDPRGTGESTPVRCEQGSAVDAYNNLDFSPDDAAERRALVEGNRQLAASCLERSGRLLSHISTVETVRDLDLLRVLVGDDSLNYFGYSYGTRIGAVYAQLLGRRTGRMVLDGAVNITEDKSVTQAAGFDRALGHFAAWCASQRCDLGDSEAAVIASITGLLNAADRRPIPTTQARPLTQSLAMTGIAVTLYGDARTWGMLRDALLQARDGRGDDLLRLADLYNGRNADGSYGAEFFAFPAIRCLDERDRGLGAADRDWEQAKQRAPILAGFMGPDLQCPVWSVPPAPQGPKLTAPDAAPIIVIGTTGDPATPYEFAVSMAKQLRSGVLVTYDGEGHGAYGGSSACVDDVVVAYFVRDEVPTGPTTCSG